MSTHPAPWSVDETIPRMMFDADGKLIGVMVDAATARRVVTAINGEPEGL